MQFSFLFGQIYLITLANYASVSKLNSCLRIELFSANGPTPCFNELQTVNSHTIQIANVYLKNDIQLFYHSKGTSIPFHELFTKSNSLVFDRNNSLQYTCTNENGNNILPTFTSCLPIVGNWVLFCTNENNLMSGL